MKMKFIEDLKKELSKTNLSAVEMQEVISDYEEMVENALETGLKESELEDKFGSPEKIVEELDNFRDDSEETPKSDNEDAKTESQKEGFEFKFKPASNYDIEVDLTNEDIHIETWDGEEIIVKPMGIKRVKEYDIDFRNNTLFVKKNQVRMFNIFGRSENGAFEVKLPKNKEMNHTKFSNVNGDGDLKGLVGNQMSFKTTNGDFTIQDCKLKALSVSSINGDLKMSEILSEKVKLSVVSGDIEINKMKIEGDFDFNSVSGDADINDFDAVNIYIKLVSGDISAKKLGAEQLTVRTVSGDVDIDNSNCEKSINHLSKSSVSGSVEIKQ